MSHPTVISGRLRIVFEPRDDRWSHRVEWRTDEGRFVPLLESVEGSPHDECEPSPPMQEVAMHVGPNGVAVALGIGMSGRNHWSIEFTPPRRAHGKPEDGLEFGLACRLRDFVPELRSSYRFVSPLRRMRIEQGIIELQGPEMRLRIRSEAELSMIEEGLAIVACPPTPRRTPHTHNWSYIIGGESATRA